jgi:AraC family transcriptional activator of pobA
VHHTAAPRFGLYGEKTVPEDGEFIHIEDIESRSARYNWAIDAHSHRGLFQLVVIFSGGVEITLDDRTTPHSAPVLSTLPPAAIHGFRFQVATDGFVLTMNEALPYALAREKGEDVRRLMEVLLSHARICHPVSETMLRLRRMMEEIQAEFRLQRIGRGAILEAMARAVLLLLAREETDVRLGVTDSRRQETFGRFRELVEAHYLEHWPVAAYAEALGVTESALNRLCRTLSGLSAFDLVQGRLVLEARRKLVYIAMPVANIAYELGFQDPAYFSRFFKRHTGLSPAAFIKGFASNFATPLTQSGRNSTYPSVQTNPATSLPRP